MDPVVVPTSTSAKALPLETAAAHQVSADPQLVTVKLGARRLSELAQPLISPLMAHAEALRSTNARDPGLETAAAHLATAVQLQATAQRVAKVLLGHALPPTSRQTVLAAAPKAMYAKAPPLAIAAAHLVTAVRQPHTVPPAAKALLGHVTLLISPLMARAAERRNTSARAPPSATAAVPMGKNSNV
jgi:hypothetical protein